MEIWLISLIILSVMLLGWLGFKFWQRTPQNHPSQSAAVPIQSPNTFESSMKQKEILWCDAHVLSSRFRRSYCLINASKCIQSNYLIRSNTACVKSIVWNVGLLSILKYYLLAPPYSKNKYCKNYNKYETEGKSIDDATWLHSHSRRRGLGNILNESLILMYSLITQISLNKDFEMDSLILFNY